MSLTAFLNNDFVAQDIVDGVPITVADAVALLDMLLTTCCWE